MEHEFVTRSQANSLKELGFDLKTREYYHCDLEAIQHSADEIRFNKYHKQFSFLGDGRVLTMEPSLKFLTSAPSVRLALEWIEENERIYLGINGHVKHGDIDLSYSFKLYEYAMIIAQNHIIYNTRKECESVGLDYALDYLQPEKLITPEDKELYKINDLKSVLTDTINDFPSGYNEKVRLHDGKWTAYSLTSGSFESFQDNDMDINIPYMLRTANKKFRYILNKIVFHISLRQFKKDNA